MPVVYLILEALLAISFILGTHAIRKRFGLGFFFAGLAFLSTITYLVSAADLATQIGPVEFRVSSAVFFTALLVGIFAAYVINGPSAGRAGMLVISCVAILLPLLGGVLGLHSVTLEQSFTVLTTPGIRIVLSSIFAIILDLIFLAISWELANKLFPRSLVFFKVFFVLLGVMWLDVVLFGLAAFWDNPNLMVILKGGITSRFIVVLAVSPLLAYYLKFQRDLYSLEFKTRPMFSIFSLADPQKLVHEAKEETRQKDLALQATTKRYELALLGADLGTWDWDIRNGEMNYNDRWADILGYQLDEITPTYKNWTAMTHPDDRAEASQAMQDLFEEKIPFYECELRMKHKSGDWIWILDRGKVIERDADGVATRACGTHLDITHRKKAEIDLRNSETRFKTYVSFAPDGIFIADAEGRYVEVNEAACKQTGYSRDELLKMRIIDILPPANQAQVMNNFLRLQELGQTSSELAILHKDGHLIHVVLSAVKLSENRFMAYCKDITDRVESEMELKASENKLRAIVENEPECVKLVAADGTLLEMNPAGLSMICASSFEEVVGKSIYNLIAADDKENFKLFNERICAGSKESLSYSIVDLKGNQHYMETTAVPFSFQADGTTVHLGITRDITERTIAEEERKNLERQVQHAQKLESLGILAGGIAHDFNNILMAILGNADLALEEISPHAPARENLQEIENAARKAAALAKQMLAYSGKGKFVVEPIFLNEFVREMVHMLDVSISKKVVIKYDFADQLPVFQADATQVRQVIMNLITNASEAIEDSDGVIGISTGVMECSREYLDRTNIAVRAGLDEPLPSGDYVFLEVSDTGCGMEKDTQEKIFDPFYSTKFTGRGLGMAAVLGIVRGHHGTIKIYSEVGKGSTIKVLFPATKDAHSPVAQKTNVSTDNKWRGEGTVLLADDEESIRTVGTLILQRLGFKVLTAKDGLDAVETYRKHQAEIVCILLDLTMPNLGGEDAFRELRAISADVRVILCSGYNEQEATQHFTGKGLSGFIQKPFAKGELQAKLQSILTS